jgi:hypothetical protein
LDLGQLAQVGGDLDLSDNAQLDDAVLDRLSYVGGELRVEANALAPADVAAL